VVELDPDNEYGYYNLGLIEQTTGREVDAEKNYREALRIEPNFTEALFNLAILRTRARALDEAATLYARVTTLDEDNAGAHLNLGIVLYSLGRNDQATAELSRAVALDPSLVGRVIATDPNAPLSPTTISPRRPARPRADDRAPVPDSTATDPPNRHPTATRRSTASRRRRPRRTERAAGDRLQA
jgi:tetratricopeptide (TPR) repeat protein